MLTYFRFGATKLQINSILNSPIFMLNRLDMHELFMCISIIYFGRACATLNSFYETVQ